MTRTEIRIRKAVWIWAPKDNDGATPEFIVARHSLTLNSLPANAVCAISASNSYKLFINGMFVAHGPERCRPHCQKVDEIDVRSYLQAGNNAFTVFVHRQRDAGSIQGEGRGGLLLEVLADGKPIASTGPAWEMLPMSPDAIEFIPISTFHDECCERRDYSAQTGPPVSAEVIIRDSGWPMYDVDQRASAYTPPWVALEPRGIPLLSYQDIPARLARPSHMSGGGVAELDKQTRTARRNEQFVLSLKVDTGESASPPFKMGEDDQRSYTIDFGEMHASFPYLDIEGDAGAIIAVLSTPYQLEGELRHPLVRSRYLDQIILGTNRVRWEAHYWKPVRYLTIMIMSEKSHVTVHAAGVRTLQYPFTDHGSLQVPAYPGLDVIREATKRTILACTTDAYTDNYRERRQYAQTSYYACLGNYATFGDTDLHRKVLIDVCSEQRSDGLMPAYAPSHSGEFMEMLDSNLFWLMSIRLYLVHSGDVETVTSLLPAAERLLSLLSRYVTDDGLLTNPPFPYWLDHAVLDRRGANLLLNGHYLSALKAIQEVYLLLGLQRSPLKPQSIEHLEGSLRTHFWNETMGAFVDAVFDGQQSPKCSEHGQAVMLMHGLVNMRQRDRLLATLRASDDHDRISRTDTGMTLVTPAMLGMLLQGLCHIGELDLAIGMLTERFEPMLANGDNGTLWEEWWLHGTGRGGKFARMNGRSDAQTESAFAPWIFARYVLGLEPRGIGCNEVVIRYLPADRMDRRSGSIPTPLGTFGIQWTKEGRHISCNVSSPSGIRVRLDLASFGDGAVIEHYAGIPRPLIPNDLLDIASGTWTVVLPAEAA